MFFDDLPTSRLPERPAPGMKPAGRVTAPREAMAKPRMRAPVPMVCDLMKEVEAWDGLGPLLRHVSGLELVHEGRLAWFSEMSTLIFPLSLLDRLALGLHAKVLRRRMAAMQIGGTTARDPLCATLERLRRFPEEWEVCAEVVHHMPSGLTLRIKDGLTGFGIAADSRVRFALGFGGGLRLWLAARPLIYRGVAAKVLEAERKRVERGTNDE